LIWTLKTGIISYLGQKSITRDQATSEYRRIPWNSQVQTRFFDFSTTNFILSVCKM